MIAVDICNTLADMNSVLEYHYGARKKGCYFHPAVNAEFFEKHPEIFAEAKPYSMAASRLRELAKTDSLVYLTARPKTAEEVTRWYLDFYGFPPADIIFTTDKAAIAKKLGVTLAIEDAPEEIINYRNVGIPVAVVAHDYNTFAENRFRWEEGPTWKKAI